jgi:hypothetical protein
MLRKDHCQILQQCLPSWRGFILPCPSDEKVIIEQLSQSLQGSADSRLTQSQPLRGPGDRFLFHERYEVN